MDKIDFPGLAEYTRSIGEDGISRSRHCTKLTYKLKCMDGLATKYDKIVVVDGEKRAFVPGCFEMSLRSNRPIQFLVQHNAPNLVATSRDNLSVIDDPKVGLTFRLRVPNTMVGQIAARMVEAGSRTAMSIGYSIEDDEVHDIAGHRVRLITRADLKEISLVKAGAIRHAFAMIVDGARTPAPRAGAMSMDFKLASINHQLQLAITDYRSTMRLDEAAAD